MYLPEHFREDRPQVLRDLMEKFPLAALVTLGAEGLVASHLPVLYDPEPAPWGTLRGHLARANGQWRDYRPEVEALAIFQGPQAYISPNWYPTKREHGRVVPTWNYAVVHAYGTLSVYAEPERLRAFLDRLTAVHESGQAKPWMPADAPPEYIEGLLKAIVGVELAITRIEGKWKVSQNQPAENRLGAAEGLEAIGDEESAEMARLTKPNAASIDGQPDRLADAARHFHQSIDGEPGRLLVHHVGHARARDHQDLGGLGPLQVMFRKRAQEPLQNAHFPSPRQNRPQKCGGFLLVEKLLRS